MKKINVVLYYLLALTLFGCSSAKMADLSSGDNTKGAVSEVTQLMQKAVNEQSDLLAIKEFRKGSDYLNRARIGLTNGYEPQLILDNAATAKAYFQDARIQSGVRSTKVSRIIQARRSALVAGLRNSDALLLALEEIDKDLRSESDTFTETLEPRDISEYQKKYFALEIKAVQFRELDRVKRAIRKASIGKAEDRAPNTLRMATLDLNEAENLIAQSPRNPKVHKKSVEKSVASSILLLDVMDVILNAEGTPENIALKIVNQNRELGILSKNVGNLEKNLQTTQSNLESTKSNLETAQSNLMETEGALKLKDEELKKSSTQVRFQNAMEEVGKLFSEDEASVYQKGSKLIFRLKKINFASGTDSIPPASKPLLVKVNNIIKTLRAEIVAVQGHTDSVGAADLNQKLSTKRAISVANYLASLVGGYKIGYIGYGESRPIASNETKVGRAINRRVDLVVTVKK